MERTNTGNRRAYRMWAPIYDRLVARVSRPGRTRSLALAALRPGERVVIVGVGTGLDLPLLPAGVRAVGVDLSAAMLARARTKLAAAAADVVLVRGDALALPLADASCDAAILHLILSVVPDAAACVREAVRVVRPGGRLAVYDKFLPDHVRPGRRRRLVNVAVSWLGSDANRRLGDMIAGQPCTVEHDEPAALGGTYRVVHLSR